MAHHSLDFAKNLESRADVAKYIHVYAFIGSAASDPSAVAQSFTPTAYIANVTSGTSSGKRTSAGVGLREAGGRVNAYYIFTVNAAPTQTGYSVPVAQVNTISPISSPPPVQGGLVTLL